MGVYRKNREKTKHAKEETQVIGIVGAGRAVGATHLSILMANYYYSGCGKRTAVLEWNRHGDFARFGDACTAAGMDREEYRIQGVDFFKTAGSRRLARCIQAGYQIVVIDFGSLQEQQDAELLRCHKVYLIVSFSEWQDGAFGNCETWQERAKEEGWHCLAVFGSEESRLQWNKRRKPAVGRIPFSADAFTISCDMMDWMMQIA